VLSLLIGDLRGFDGFRSFLLDDFDYFGGSLCSLLNFFSDVRVLLGLFLLLLLGLSNLYFRKISLLHLNLSLESSFVLLSLGYSSI